MRNQESIAWVRLLVARLALAKRAVFYLGSQAWGQHCLGWEGSTMLGGPGGASSSAETSFGMNLASEAVLVLLSLPKRVSTR